MCGIVGTYHSDGTQVDKETLIHMRDAVYHRGPDDEGAWISADGRAGLGFRRLSIVDLSAEANQPISNESGTIWLVCNGEIYNCHALRQQLEARGHQFRTKHNDTEVIVHAFEEWSIDCVQRLQGMFAFALWDDRQKTLWLVRDRMGMKPLYYTRQNGRFFFASEITAFFATQTIPKTINQAAIYHYLTFLTVPAPHTMFRDIYKVPAGTLLRVDQAGEIHHHTYWNAADFLNNPLPSEKQTTVLAKTQTLLLDAVQTHMLSDVPMGATLSSGVDSSLVTAIMRDKWVDLRAVVVDYQIESSYSESKIAQEIAHHLNVTHFETLTVDDEMFYEAFWQCIQIQIDHPVGAQDIILFFLLAKHLRQQGIKVCLLGEGADELGGYPKYLTMWDEYEQLHAFAQQPLAVKQQQYQNASPLKRQQLEVAMTPFVISRKHIQSLSETDKKEMWVGSPVASSYEVLQQMMQEVAVDTPDQFVRQVLNVEFKLRLPEFMLPRVDYPTMATGLEARIPFLDHPLVEYYLQLPSHIKMYNRQPKYAFKRLLTNYGVPNDIVYKKKLGFGRVLSPLLANALLKWFKAQIIDQKDHPIYAFLEAKKLKALYQAHMGARQYGFKMWTIYALAKWLEVIGGDG